MAPRVASTKKRLGSNRNRVRGGGRSVTRPTTRIWHAALALLLTLIASLALLGAPATIAATPTTALSLAIEPPPVTAKAAYAFDMDAGTDLYDLNADERLPPGSTSKIATALLVVRHADLSDKVTIEESDRVDIEVFSNMGLVAGETLTVEQLLWGLLLPSGSDAANALARVVGATLPGGDPNNADASRAAFVVGLNELAAELGLANTKFVNPSGNDAPEHYSSARDLARLAAELLKNETLATIVDTPTWQGVSVGAEQRQISVANVNQLLLEDEAVLGVKTGATPKAGTCLVAARRYGDGNRVVAVVLGSTGQYGSEGILVEDERWNDMRTMFGSLSEDFLWISPSAPDILPGLAEELAVWNATMPPGPTFPVPAADLTDLRYRLVLGPEAAPGTEVGRVHFYSGSTELGAQPVVQR